MVAHVFTVAFQGIEISPIEIQVQIAGGLPTFTIVGLPDKAVAESRERIRASFQAIGLALPAKRITVNLAPADVQKEGSHYDLPIALGLMVAMNVIAEEDIIDYSIIGELGLDGSLAAVTGALPAAIDAASRGRGLICPKPCGSEAAWAGNKDILAPDSLLSLINHFKGTQVLTPPEPKISSPKLSSQDFAEIKGQESAKRALEIAAAGGHHVLMVGPPGAGKSMLAQRLTTILPALSPKEALEVTVLHSLAGLLPESGLISQRPFRDPHHSASLVALVGGGFKSRPGEISLAHQGVLFLDELPEFAHSTLEALRQPIETGRIIVARANAHMTYPARVQVIAAMNPCRCGYFGEAERTCGRAPRCAQDYQRRISGPLLDRFDIRFALSPVPIPELVNLPTGDSSQTIAKRVFQARQLQQERNPDGHLNATLEGNALESVACPDEEGKELLIKAIEHYRLSGRGYHRILRVARTLADLEGCPTLLKEHIAEALSYRCSGLISA